MQKLVTRLLYNTEDYLFLETNLTKGFIHEINDFWEHRWQDEGNIETLGKVIYHSDTPARDSTVWVIDTGNSSFKLAVDKRYARVEANGKTVEEALNTIEKLKSFITKAPEVTSKEISVRFWMNGAGGPTSTNRKIDVPFWKDIEHNYASGTRESLGNLITQFRPTKGGQIILWHGLPGTGKTYALRALCREWRNWCTTDYILDPESLFGHSPQYLSTLVFSSESIDDDIEALADDEIFNEKEFEQNKDKWKLLILEDTGELLSESAKERAGQGLSRLLNVADGFIGQGLKVLVLITTNEEIEKLHPAVSRPGRCAAIIKFNPLSREDIIAWSKEHDILIPEKREGLTVADLYEKLEERKQIVTPEKKKEGFGFKIPAAQSNNA